MGGGTDISHVISISCFCFVLKIMSLSLLHLLIVVSGYVESIFTVTSVLSLNFAAEKL